MKIDWKGFYKDWLLFILCGIMGISLCAAIVLPLIYIATFMQNLLGMILFLLWLFFIIGMIVAFLKNKKI